MSPPSYQENPLAQDWNKLDANNQLGSKNSDYPEHLAAPGKPPVPTAAAAAPEKPRTLEDVDNQVLPALRANAGANNPPEYAPGEEFNEDEA